MKVTFPKNIQKGLLAGMTLNLGPVSVTIVQLFLLAVGVGLALAIFKTASQSGSTAAGIMFAIPVLAIFIVMAFFKISEMGLLEYIAKLIRNKMYDAPKKFQTNFEKENPVDLIIKKSQIEEKKQVIEQKDSKISKDLLEQIEKGGLI
ncbi:MAG: hypothetical protein M0P94_02905 [Candidatus Absconditabacterales bacterium]|nr:hypothetical protein [Candidatus Absconditabacterales bacterium]